MKTHIKQPKPVSHTIQSKTKAANQARVQKVLQKYKETTAQRAEMEDDELLQGKFDVAQKEALDDELLQGKFETAQREETQIPPSGGRGTNQTGIPDDMKAQFENLSGFSFDDVRVHYNSDKPAQLQALAYTQGNQVHIASGQEKHLGHELGHVVQQKQGRVQPTMQLQGVNVNDNEGLEKEADHMLQCKTAVEVNGGNEIIQMQIFTAGTPVYAGGIINCPGEVVRFDEDSGNYIIKVEYGGEVWIDRSLVRLLSESDRLMEAKNADSEDIAAIAYSEAAQRFEMALGVCLSQYPPAVNEVKELLKICVEKFSIEENREKYGKGDETVAGAVGTDNDVLNAVVNSGNLRERLTMIFNMTRDLAGSDNPAPKQQFRRKQGENDKKGRLVDHIVPKVPIISPPLSDREKKFMRDRNISPAKPQWKPGGNVWDCAMDTALQKEANDLSIPIVADISGTAHRIMNVAKKHGANLQNIRLALLGYLIPGRQHSFHEIMEACKSFGLPYENTDERYAHITPLTEDQLRNVAAYYGGDRRFPHEVGVPLLRSFTKK